LRSEVQPAQTNNESTANIVVDKSNSDSVVCSPSAAPLGKKSFRRPWFQCLPCSIRRAKWGICVHILLCGGIFHLWSLGRKNFMVFT